VPFHVHDLQVRFHAEGKLFYWGCTRYAFKRVHDNCSLNIFKSRNAWHSPACSPPGANAPAKRRGYFTKVHQASIRLSDGEGSSAVLTHASVVECHHTEWRWGTLIFADWRPPKIGYHSNVPWAIAKKVWLIMPILKFCEYRSSPFWDHWWTRQKVLWEITTPRESEIWGFCRQHLATLATPTVRSIKCKQSPVYGVFWPLLPRPSTYRNETRTWSSLSP